MAKKKNILSSSTLDVHASMIGISCHMKSYKLSFSINKVLKFNFQRLKDFETPGITGGEVLCFPFLAFNDDDLKNHFCLISNHHPQGKLIPALRQVDYFLIAKNPVDRYTKQRILSKLRSISQVLAAYEINPNGNKDLPALLDDLELHLMMANKKKPPARA